MKHKKAKGFTLVELTIFIVIVGIIFTMVGSIILESSRVVPFVMVRTGLAQKLDNALAFMANDLKGIPWKREEFPCLDLVAETSLTIGCGHELTYYWDSPGQRLIRSRGGVDNVLLDGVVNFEFNYIDFKDEPLSVFSPTNRLRVATIEVFITVSEGGQVISQRIRIRPNNLNQQLIYKFS